MLLVVHTDFRGSRKDVPMWWTGDDVVHIRRSDLKWAFKVGHLLNNSNINNQAGQVSDELIRSKVDGYNRKPPTPTGDRVVHTRYFACDSHTAVEAAAGIPCICSSIQPFVRRFLGS